MAHDEGIEELYDSGGDHEYESSDSEPEDSGHEDELDSPDSDSGSVALPKGKNSLKLKTHANRVLDSQIGKDLTKLCAIYQVEPHKLQGFMDMPISQELLAAITATQGKNSEEATKAESVGSFEPMTNREIKLLAKTYKSFILVTLRRSWKDTAVAYNCNVEAEFNDDLYDDPVNRFRTSTFLRKVFREAQKAPIGSLRNINFLQGYLEAMDESKAKALVPKPAPFLSKYLYFGDPESEFVTYNLASGLY